MKKAFDQTVRELKREVNKKVLKVPGIEQKILDATSNEPWGPHGSHLAEIAQATRNYHECQMIINVIWKRINDIGKNWRHVYKALTVLEYLVAHGSERVIDEIREHAYQISTLSDFQYIDSGGRDQGSNVRRKSQSLVALINDKERIQEVRQKALANRDKYHSTYSTGGTYRPSSYSGNGGYGDRNDDDRFEGRYGNRDEDRNVYGRERDLGYKDDDRYGRGGDSYNRDGDRYGRDSDERYGRDSYRDDDYRGGRGNDDQFGSRNRSYDRDRDRSFDEDDQYASRGGGSRGDDAFQDERRIERKLSEQNVSAPPSYEEPIRDAPNHVQGEKDGSAPKASSPPEYKAGSPSERRNQGPNHVMAGVSASTQNKEVDVFDEFDPRGSVPAAPPAASTSQMDFFGTQASDPVNSLALVPVSYSTTNSEADLPTNSGFGTSFVSLSSASASMSQPSEDPFGDSPFKATPQEGFLGQQQNFAPPTSFQPAPTSIVGAEPLPPVAPKMETSPSFDFGGPLGGLTYTPTVANSQHSSPNPYTPTVANGQQSSANPFTRVANGQNSSGNPAFLAPELPAAQVSSDVLGVLLPQAGAAPSVSSHGAQTNIQTANMNFPQQSGPSSHLGSPISSQAAQPVVPTNLQTAPMNILQQPGLPATLTATTGSAAKTHPSKDKFEPKSTVWADTLSRGLVNLNISGSKINPLADIGIDFDSINRMEKRKEKEKSSASPVASTTTMGKAMGSGSGIGRAGSSGLATPPNLAMGSGMGVGIGMSGGAGMGMGLGGYGGRMNQQPMGMGMNMGAPMMRPTTGMPPSGPGMSGVGYNPMMGMGSYGSQQPYGGGYR